MTRRVRFKQCDFERALRAAKKVGAARVLVTPNGEIVIEMGPEKVEWPDIRELQRKLDEERLIIL